MKLLYIHQYFVFPSESGGTRSYDLATSFVKKGIEVEIVTSSSLIDCATSLSNRWNIIRKDGLVLHVLSLNYNNKMSYPNRIFIFFKFMWFCTWKVISLKPNVILATSTPLTIGIPALIKRWIHKTPYIFETRDLWPEAVIAIGAIRNKFLQRIMYKLEWIIYKNAYAIVPLSSDMKNSILRRYPALSGKPIVVIENISEVERFQNGFNKEDSFIQSEIGFKPKISILYAGTFGKVNNIDYIINFAERLAKKNVDVSFILIGAGSEKERIINLAKERSLLNKNVFILNPIPKNRLPQVYSEVTMGSSFVASIPELWANSANKFFDTLAAGKPILINYEGWQADIIREKNIGYVLNSTLQEDDEVRAFSDFLNNKELNRIQKINSLNLAKANYSLEKAVSKYLTIFRQLKIH